MRDIYGHLLYKTGVGWFRISEFRTKIYKSQFLKNRILHVFKQNSFFVESLIDLLYCTALYFIVVLYFIAMYCTVVLSRWPEEDLFVHMKHNDVWDIIHRIIYCPVAKVKQFFKRMMVMN